MSDEIIVKRFIDQKCVVREARGDLERTHNVRKHGIDDTGGKSK